jgi:hypothetical protein
MYIGDVILCVLFYTLYINWETNSFIISNSVHYLSPYYGQIIKFREANKDVFQLKKNWFIGRPQAT